MRPRCVQSGWLCACASTLLFFFFLFLSRYVFVCERRCKAARTCWLHLLRNEHFCHDSLLMRRLAARCARVALRVRSALLLAVAAAVAQLGLLQPSGIARSF